jgi:RND family efflux transporter MFP subunit
MTCHRLPLTRLFPPRFFSALLSCFHLPFVLFLISAFILTGPGAFAAGDHGHAQAEPFQKTIWSGKTEVLMEYDPPVIGKLGGVQLRLTNLDTFKPLTEVKVVLTLTADDGKTIKETLKSVGRPGLYRGTLGPARSGKHRLEIRLESPNFSDTAGCDDVMVYRKDETIPTTCSLAGAVGSPVIAFPKDQQWAVEFGVRPPEDRNMPPMLTVSGELTANPTAEVVISAPLAGMVAFHRPISHLGQRVAKDEEICHVEAPIFQDGGADQLAAQVAEARNKVLLARKERDRAQRLVDGKAAPYKRLEEAEIMLKIAQSNLAPLSKALGRVQSGTHCRHLVLKSPLSGTVIEVNAINGAYVQAGQPLVRVVDTSKLWLKANIPLSEATHLDHLSSAYFTVSGMTEEFKPSRLITVNDVVDTKTRTVQTILEVDNTAGKLKVGMYANIVLQAGHADNTLAVPNSAIFEDEGRFFVYIQTGGETFIRREVTLGNRNAGFTAIVKGLTANDRVVITGGYYVKQASQASQMPAGDGHVH